MKPTAVVLTKFAKRGACETATQKCKKLGKFFVRACPKFHQRIGGNVCLAECPLGWNDQGPRCQKPENIHIGHPFSWTNGDN